MLKRFTSKLLCCLMLLYGYPLHALPTAEVRSAEEIVELLHAEKLVATLDALPAWPEDGDGFGLPDLGVRGRIGGLWDSALVGAESFAFQPWGDAFSILLGAAGSSGLGAGGGKVPPVPPGFPRRPNQLADLYAGLNPERG